MDNNIKKKPNLFKFVFGIALGVAGFALIVMIWAGMPFLATISDSYWRMPFVLVLIGSWYLGYYLAKDAGWSNKKKKRSSRY